MPRFRISIILITLGLLTTLGVYLWIDRLAALVLCVVGALVTLAVLFKRFAPKSPYELKIEQDGKILIFLTIGLGFAALNTGSNLLYLLLGILLSLIIFSGILSQRVLMYLRVHRTFPRLVRAEVPVVYKTTTHNLKRWFPSYHVVVSVDAKSLVSGADTFVPLIEAGKNAERFNTLTFHRRGLISLKSLNHDISTRFPFGFFTKKKRCSVPDSVLVLPASISVDELPLSLSGRLEQQNIKKNEDDEFFGLRPFEAGDDFKRIEWKRSTLGDEFIVKQMQPQQGEDLHLWLYRSAEPRSFSPTEEFWISVASTVIEQAHQRQRTIHLHLGEKVQVLSAQMPSPEPLWRELALLDTHLLSQDTANAHPNDWLIDVSSTIPDRSGDSV